MEFLKGIKPRKYQQQIFENCIDNNCIVVLPTGLGKTLIALMLTIERMKKYPGEKALFLAPTKPLVEQHFNYFKKHLPALFADMQVFTGKIPSQKRKKLWETADIIFSTPQCVANDLKNNLYTLKEVCLLIEDEAHRCVKNYSYTFIAKKYLEQANHPRILGLTASPGTEKSKIISICKNLSIQKVEVKTRDSPEVKEYLQELEFEKIKIPFPPEFEEIRQAISSLLTKYTDELRKRGLLFGPASKTNLIQLQKKLANSLSYGIRNYNHLHAASACAQAIKLQHALELLETQTLEGFNKYLKTLFKSAAQKQSKGVVRLVAKPEFNFAYIKSTELLAKKIEHPKLKKLTEILQKEISENNKLKTIVFSQFRNTAAKISEKLNEIEGISSKVFVGQLKKEGLGLNQKEQKKILEEFASGRINTLCATSIGEEGLDIPEVNLVIFYEPIPSAIRAIQRRGRTARLQKGKLIILMTNKTRDEAFYYISRAKEKKMQRSLEFVEREISKKSLAKKKEVQKRLA